MDETLYIVIYKAIESGRWQPMAEGIFAERRLAENFIECKQQAGYNFRFRIVEGPITSPYLMAKAEEALGAF